MIVYVPSAICWQKMLRANGKPIQLPEGVIGVMWVYADEQEAAQLMPDREILHIQVEKGPNDNHDQV